MTERILWNYVRKIMRGRWHAQRHEDGIAAGIPDVSYGIVGADGWIELKVLDAWPTDAPVRVRITPEQVAWLWARGSAGAGRCFVLLRVADEHFLIRWHKARDLFRTDLSPDDLRRLAEVRWDGRVDPDELEAALRRPYPHPAGEDFHDE